MRKQSISFGEALLWGIGGLAAILGLGRIINNPQSSSNLRFVAQTVEGIIVQDLATGLFYILV